MIAITIHLQSSAKFDKGEATQLRGQLQLFRYSVLSKVLGKAAESTKLLQIF